MQDCALCSPPLAVDCTSKALAGMHSKSALSAQGAAHQHGLERGGVSETSNCFCSGLTAFWMLNNQGRPHAKHLLQRGWLGLRHLFRDQAIANVQDFGLSRLFWKQESCMDATPI